MGYKGRTTVHGFRSSFRDWGGEQTRDSLPMYADRDLEFCLAHKLPDATEASYRRMTALDRRRVIMQHWADFALGTTTNVVQLPQAAKAVA
jgi:integrase